MATMKASLWFTVCLGLHLIISSFINPSLGTGEHRDQHHGDDRSRRSVGAADEVPSETPASSNCTQCGAEPGGAGSTAVRDAKRSYRLESIKAEILRKLQLRAPPNITGRRLPALPHIQRIINQLSTGDLTESIPFGSAGFSTVDDMEPGVEGFHLDSDDERATTMKIIQVSKTVPANRLLDSTQQNYICYFSFPMSEIHQVSQIVRVTFGIYVRPVVYNPASSPPHPTWLLVYMLRSTGERQLLKKRLLTLSGRETGRWYYFHIQPNDIAHWINEPSSNYGLQVQSSNGRGEPLAIVTPQNDNEEPFRPYIEVETNDLSNSRAKRNLDMNCDERSTERRCCRYPLIVDFDSFQWDWVIVPKRYSAFYCSGECPYLFVQQNPATHLSHLARQSRGGSGGGPCCSPRKVSSISMLYYDDHMNIVYGRLPGMVVDRCACS